MPKSMYAFEIPNYDSPDLDQFHPGEKVWAFYYRDIDGGFKVLKQRPIQGILLSRKYAYDDMSHVDPTRPVEYFVPIGKTGNPMWSKVIDASSRMYARTEKEAIIGYNEHIKGNIQALEKSMAFLQDRIAKCKAETIPVPDEPAESE